MVTYTTLSPTDQYAQFASPVLSNGNLTVAFSATGSQTVRAVDGQSTGKYYFEATLSGSVNANFGVMSASGLLVNANSDSFNRAAIAGYYPYVLAAITNYGTTLGGFNTMVTAGFAIDVGGALGWVSDETGGNWNATSATPGVSGGVAFNAGMSAPLKPVVFVYSAGAATMILNFGASAFAHTVPAGFTAGWPGAAPAAAPFDFFFGA